MRPPRAAPRMTVRARIALDTGSEGRGDAAGRDDPIDVLVLAPHFDDAALSLGATIHRWTHEGLRVVVVTMCGAAPPPGPLSAFAAEHHARWAAAAGSTWGDAAAVVEARRAEDRAALALLLAEPWAMDVPDAIYRRVHHRGRDLWPYADAAALFGPPHRREAALGRAVADALGTVRPVASDVRWIVPLGIGGHVDHRLGRAAGELAAWRAKRAVLYYADYPYARTPGAAARVLAAEPRRLEAADDPLAAGPADLAAKIAAIAAYRSQLTTFWPSEDAMAADVGSWSERIWRPGAMDEGG